MACTRGCGTILVRKVHFIDAICPPCKRREAMERRMPYERRVREQARRYRIVCHVLGWTEEQFDDMLASMRESPMAFRPYHPEGRAARFDLSLARRAR